jgi:hypothetical protein
MLSTPGTQPYTVPHDGNRTRGAKLLLKEFFLCNQAGSHDDETDQCCGSH